MLKYFTNNYFIDAPSGGLVRTVYMWIINPQPSLVSW